MTRRESLGRRIVEFGLRVGGGAVLAWFDRVRLANTPTFGHWVYHSPDGRVLVIDPMELTPDLRVQIDGIQRGAVQMPRRFVVQLTAIGEPPYRVELPLIEARKMIAAMQVWIGDDTAL